MKDIKFKIFASALASVLLVGCNDLDKIGRAHV